MAPKCGLAEESYVSGAPRKFHEGDLQSSNGCVGNWRRILWSAHCSGAVKRIAVAIDVKALESEKTASWHASG